MSSWRRRWTAWSSAIAGPAPARQQGRPGGRRSAV
jgi:hypothetical protein